MSVRDLLLILHILSAFLLVAGLGATTALGIYAGGERSARVIAMATGLQRRAALMATWPGLVLVLVFGIWLVIESDFDFAAPWISLSFLLWIVIAVLGPWVLGRHVRRVNEHAYRLMAEGTEESVDLVAEYNAARPRLVGLLLNVSVVVFVYLMVAKPGS